MRRWGVIITAFYCVAVVGLLGPGLLWLASKEPTFKDLYGSVTSVWWWIWLGVLVGGEALLLFLSVDTSWRRRRPRQHLAVTTIFVGLAVGLLAFSASWSLLVGIYGDRTPPWLSSPMPVLQAASLGLWAVWAGLFYGYYRSSPRVIATAVAWLLAGSVLELLIAVPTHLLVRRRSECTAPIVTGFGIVAGLAIMLLSFGPGVLGLYKKRLDAYERPK